MGEIFVARDSRLQRKVAVKDLPRKLADDADALVRFEREAQVVASLSHPNILAIHDFGTQLGVTYAVMELLEGENLRRWMESENLSPHEILDLALQIANGLAAAHSRGVIHRDLKPENVFLRRHG
jgi:serine/threonine protein kinase